MKFSQQAVLNSRIGLVFVAVGLLPGCKEQGVTKLSIEGNYVVISTAIFLTDGETEKEDLFNTCISKKFIIQADKLYADTACMFEGVKEITIVDSFQTTVDSFPVMNTTKFSYFIDDRVDSHDSIWVFKAREIFSDRTEDSLYLVKKSIDTIILVRDPFFLKMVRDSSKVFSAK